MFGRKVSKVPQGSQLIAPQVYRPIFIESLEERQFLSASAVHHAVHVHVAHHATAKHATLKHTATKSSSSPASSSGTSTSTTITTNSSATSGSSTTDQGSGQGLVYTIPFSEAPSLVQGGLTTLAATDGLAAPTSTQVVYLANDDGMEMYTLDYTSAGTTTRVTVDQSGAAVTAPTQTTTTWAALDGTGTGSDAAAAAEILAIATALNLTAPTATAVVTVSTTAAGAVTYTVRLGSSSSTSTTPNDWDMPISVDSSGNPVGNQNIPFAAFPAGIQTGFNNHLPTGVAALASSSTQIVNVRTLDGATTYSTTFTTSGTSTVVTINAAGDLATLPSDTATEFSDIPLAAQTELQTLATADGVSGTISSTQSVTAYDEGNGTIIYAVTLSATDSSTSDTFTITIASDQAGNPTVPPNHGRGGGCEGGDMGGDDSSDYGSVDFGMASFGGGGHHL